jgi:hypothetical protein
VANYEKPDVMKPCRVCGKEIAAEAFSCPHCGAPYPAKAKWDGWGFEYKSQTTLLGWPLVHISFKYRPNRVPVPAKGIIAVGQFACGFFTLSQFGIGVISVSQFTVAAFALAQFAAAYSLIAQIGIYIHEGHGQLVFRLTDLLGRF